MNEWTGEHSGDNEAQTLTHPHSTSASYRRMSPLTVSEEASSLMVGPLLAAEESRVLLYQHIANIYRHTTGPPPETGNAVCAIGHASHRPRCRSLRSRLRARGARWR